MIKYEIKSSHKSLIINNPTEFCANRTADLQNIGNALGIRDLRHRGGRPLQFHCRCSRQKVEEAIATLPQGDIDEILSEGKPHSVTCHMCASDYRLTCAEIRDLRTSLP